MRFPGLDVTKGSSSVTISGLSDAVKPSSEDVASENRVANSLGSEVSRSGGFVRGTRVEVTNPRGSRVGGSSGGSEKPSGNDDGGEGTSSGLLVDGGDIPGSANKIQISSSYMLFYSM